jgi:hypothetical protein
MKGALVQTAYRVRRTSEISIRYAVVDFTDALFADLASQSAASMIETASEVDGPRTLEAPSMALDQTAGTPIREHELTVGFNLYLTGHRLKWQHDIGWLRHTLATETRDDIHARSQFQLTF